MKVKQVTDASFKKYGRRRNALFTACAVDELRCISFQNAWNRYAYLPSVLLYEPDQSGSRYRNRSLERKYPLCGRVAYYILRKA